MQSRPAEHGRHRDRSAARVYGVRRDTVKKTCPHCGEGTLVKGYSHRFLLRCNNFQACGRYVAR